MAAGRISVRLGKTSWPPGRGSTAGQTLAPRGSGWQQHSLGLHRAWPGLSVRPLLVTRWLCGGEASVVPALPLAAPCEPRGWSIHAAPVLPTAAMLCEHQPGLGLPRGCWGLSLAPRGGRGLTRPSPLVMAMAAASQGEIQQGS